MDESVADGAPGSSSRVFGRARSLAVVVVAMAAVVAFCAWVVADKLSDYRRSERLLAAGGLIRAAQKAAAELQSERGLVVLRALEEAPEQPAWLAQLGKQHEASDASLARLGQMAAAYGVAADIRTDELQASLASLRTGLEGRRDVAAALEGYGGLINDLLGGTSILLREEGTYFISTYIDLGLIIDRLARERAIGATLLGGVRHPRLRDLFHSAHVERNALIDSFLGHSSPEQGALLNAIVTSPLSVEVERLHEDLTAGRLKPEDSEKWFRLHGDLLARFADADVKLASHLQEVISGRHFTAQSTFYLVLAGVVLVLVSALETLRRGERRVAQAEADARKLLRAVEQSPLAVMITDNAGNIEYTNPAFSAQTGYGRDEVRGRNPRLLKPEQGTATDFGGMWRTIAAGHEWRGEVCNRRKDGTTYWEAMTIAPVKNDDGKVVNYIAFKEDVSEVKSLRTALERERDDIRLMLDTLYDGIALIADDGVIEYANAALRRDFGDIGDRRCSAFFNMSDEICAPCLAAMREGRAAELEPREWVSPVNGRVYEVSAARVHTTDGRAATLEVFHDVTLRKQAETAMIDAREAAELANRAKSEFLATMSHELRTPLNAIIGFSEIIAGELLGPVDQRPYVEYARDIHASGRNLLQLINDILDVARLEVGRVALREEEVDIAQAVRSAVTLVKGRADEGGIAVNEEIADGLPRLWGDERRIKQMLVSVVGNAVKFTPGGGRVVVRAGPDANGGIEIAVSDTGIGIAPEDIEKIMAPFGQADSGLARRYEGSGLGLPLAHKLVELHGGSLSIESRLGHGTVVTLRFPQERSRPDGRSAAD